MSFIRNIRKNYRHTIFACYLGYITQAVVNMFPPLLFLIFQDAFHISLAQVTTLVTVNFCVQILVDLIAGKISDRVGYRTMAVSAHAVAVIGLTGFAWLPDLLPDPYVGLLVCIILNAIGGGLDEVLISPMVEACPDEKNKKTAMGLLHSFYCWGVVGVVLLTTLFLSLAGKGSWRILCMLWGVVPLLDALYFTQVPIRTLNEDGEGMSYLDLFKNETFWLLAVLMITAGACEQAMAQWASAFAEAGLGVSKTVGDLLGPCMFALLMGTARVIYAKNAPRIDLLKTIMISGGLCLAAYLITVLAPHPIISLLGCAICGFSVGIFWPGFFSLATIKLPRGGTAMFALMAFAGDVGCFGGPTLVGLVSSACNDQLKMGLAFAMIFPVVLILTCAVLKKRKTAGNNGT